MRSDARVDYRRQVSNWGLIATANEGIAWARADYMLLITCCSALSGAKNIVLSPTVVVRTSLQKRLGGYLADLPYASGMEMWLRLAAHSDVGIIAADQAGYRAHAGNMSSEHAPSGEGTLVGHSGLDLLTLSSLRP